MKVLFTGDFVHSGEGLVEFGDSVRKLIKASDYACCNVEGPIIDSSVVRDCKSDKRGPSLFNKDGVERVLCDLGFSFVSLANNHIMDYGGEGLRSTIERLNEKSINYIGAGFCEKEAYRYLVLEKELSVAIISVAEKQFWPCEDNKPGFAWMYHPNIYRMIKQAKEECDYVIVMCHCGCEGINVPLPQVRDLYRQFIDFDADLVIGNHPHMIQGMEQYKDRFIFYSLGNLWTCNEKKDNIDSLAVMVEMSNGEGIRVYPCEIGETRCKIEVKNNNDNFEEATRLLKKDNIGEYIKRIDDYCSAYYEDLKSFYAAIIGFDIDSIDKQRKFIDHRIAGDPLSFDDLFVWHNSSIETNRWIAERAIGR